MLVRLKDHKDETVWINPVYVRLLRQKKVYTEVYVVTGSGASTGLIKCKEPIDEIAMQINVGLLGESGLPPGAENAAMPAASSNPAINAALMG